MTFLRHLWQGLSRTLVRDCKHACSRLADTLNIQFDWFYVNVPLNPFPWQFSRKLHLICIRLKIFIAKFETVVDKMLSYSVYFEIKHQKWWTCMCIFVEYMCVKFAWKVPLVIEILAKQHRGSFYGTPCMWHVLYKSVRGSMKLRHGHLLLYTFFFAAH